MLSQKLCRNKHVYTKNAFKTDKEKIFTVANLILKFARSPAGLFSGKKETDQKFDL